MQTVKKRTRVAVLLLKEQTLRQKLVIRNKEEHFIMIKGSLHQEDVTIINLYASNNRTSIHEAKN